MSEAVIVKKYVAELIGTFVLVFMGCGSAVLSPVRTLARAMHKSRFQK